MILKEFFKFKNNLKIHDVRYFRPELLEMLAHVVKFCHVRGLQCVITSGIRSEEENRALRARSNTHCEGRAFDISVHGWTTDDIDELVIDMTEKFKDTGAITKDGISKPIYFHDAGNGAHLHIQVRRV